MAETLEQLQEIKNPELHQVGIRTLRRCVADAHLNLDEAIYMLKRAEALALLAGTDGGQDWKKIGPNEAAQKVGAVIVLDANPAYQRHRSDLRNAKRELALAEAEVEAYLDTRRREREAITAHLADVLAMGGIVRDATEVLR